jgi:hypothetical protein
MFRSALVVLAAALLSAASAAGNPKPPLTKSVVGHYTLEQQLESTDFMGCLRAGGFDRLLSGKEVRALSPERQRQWKQTFWNCFRQHLEPKPATLTTDYQCWIAGREHPLEDCAPAE